MSGVQLATLRNGLRVVTEAMPGLASAAVGLWVEAGARHETQAENGIAHFLEHMAFKGTARRSALRIAEEIEDVGGHINAYTSREMTAYYARVLEPDVPLALDILADILRHSTFEPREIEVERGVILQEIGQSLDTPDDVIFDWLQEVSFPGQAIGRSILGAAEGVGGFGRDQLTGFVARHYGPSRMILAAAGAVDHDRILALAEALLGDLAPGAAPQLEPARFVSGERRAVKRLEQAHVALALPGPALRDPRMPVAQVHATALGGGMSSRLFQTLREERGLCYTVFAQAAAYADAGTLTVYAGTGADEAGQLLNLAIDEFRRAAEDMTEAEVARARAQLKAGMLMGLESPSARAERLARLLSAWGRVPEVAEQVAEIEAVDAAAVRGYGAAMAQASEMAVALYGPVKRAPGLEALRARLAA